MEYIYLECPYYKMHSGDPNPGMGDHGEGTCNQGCSEEPTCITSEPTEGWDPTRPALWAIDAFLPDYGIAVTSHDNLLQDLPPVPGEEIHVTVIDEDGFIVHEMLRAVVTGVSTTAIEFCYDPEELQNIL